MASLTKVDVSPTTSSVFTTTIPMTTRFTPPASCSSSWTYEGSGANLVARGLLLQNAASSDNVDPSCWPSGFDNIGRVQPTQAFSPGYCPVGYTTADLAIAQSVTSAACCLSGFAYIGSVLDNNGLTYAGCTKMFPSGSSTIVTVRQGHGSSTQVTGPVTMWAQPILVELESSDLSLFVSPTTSTTKSTPTTTETPSTTQSQTTGAMTTSTSPSTTNSPASGGLSSGAKAGIGVGVGLGVVGALALVAALFLIRRRKQSHPPPEGPVSYSPNPSQSVYPAYPSTDMYAAELNGRKDRPGEGGLSPVELEGRN